ncbi:YlbF family regulator [Alicyclobacillaceae bacterium I2511]|nr:YlbF family regulator [Alicyclobacillaceae bacterium I2511]
MNDLELQFLQNVDKISPHAQQQQLILAKSQQIGKLLLCSEQAQVYWAARAQMEHHPRAQLLFTRLKNETNRLLSLQQTLPIDHPRLQAIVKKTTELEDELYKTPVAMQYKTAQADLNELVQGVFQLMISLISQVIPVESGPRQCSAAEGKGCSCGS